MLGFALEAVDVSDPGQVMRWARALIDSGCVPDILICHAAVINDPAPLWRVPGLEFHNVITTQVRGTGYTLQALVSAMDSQGRGLVVIVSRGGRRVAAEMAPYCASNWAAEALTLALRSARWDGSRDDRPRYGENRCAPQVLPEYWKECELPDAWARRAANFVLRQLAADNGCHMTVPGP